MEENKELDARICNKCKRLKWDDEFCADSSKEDKIRSICKVCTSLYWETYYQQNRDLLILHSTEYSKSNRDKSNSRAKKYYLSHQDDRSQYNKQYYKENKNEIVKRSAEYNKSHPEQRKEITNTWRRDNKPKIRALAAKRRASTRTPAWANLELIKKFYINCPKGMTVDHIVPLQGKNVSGLHVEYNLQYLTPSENSSKGNKFPIGVSNVRKSR